MSANETAAPASRTFTAATIVIALAATSALTVWLMVAMPVLSGEKAPAHTDHYPYVFAHALGGTLMLFAGALALYVGWTRRLFRFQNWGVIPEGVTCIEDDGQSKGPLLPHFVRSCVSSASP